MARQNEFEPAKDGKFTRRDFLRISGGLLISVTFADLLAACAPETLTETVTKTTTTTKTNLNTVVNTATETATSVVNVTETATIRLPILLLKRWSRSI
jgi:hypothetical protein